jgi:N,N-dimethylformamidase
MPNAEHATEPIDAAPGTGHDWMPVVGYTDRLSVAPGERIRFMVSTTAPSYRASLVRLIHGDEHPDGPGFKDERVPSAIDGEHPGRVQRLPLGSSVDVPQGPELTPDRAFTLATWVWPTAPGEGAQALLGRFDGDRGCALVLDADGAPALWLGAGEGRVQRVSTGVPLPPRTWHLVVASVDPAAGRVTVRQRPGHRLPADLAADGDATLEPWDAAEAPFRIAALGGTATAHFNGKLEAPSVFGEAAGEDAVRRLAAGALATEAGPAVLATWDFAQDISSVHVRDVGPFGAHGELVNMPLRAATGRRWTGDETCWTRAPEQYAAVHFHDDDLEDAGWEADFELEVPDELRSGVYAAHLTVDGAEDYVPFFVRAPRDRATAPVALLIPTVSYVVYANEHLSYQNPRTPPAFERIAERLAPQDAYVRAERLLSCYDHHSDGSGVVYASRLRPLVTMRPKYDLALIDAPHQLGADLHLVDWLEEMGHAYDVITDEDLHEEGAELLGRYRVVVSGSHPEYWTSPMMHGLEAYLDTGGRFMYLGGNGLCWVTAVHPERPHVMELRRGDTEGAIWESEPGESFHSTTGELGGYWPRRGRGRQTVGVWFTGQGFDRSHPYRRLPGSFDPRAGWIFDGLGEDEPIGDFGLVMGGAAGFEIDRLDYGAGTPPHALLLASAAEGFSDNYDGLQADWLLPAHQRALQDRLGPPAAGEVVQYVRGAGGPTNPLVRADMVFFETGGGGAVFSTGSIAWCGSLSHQGYRNNVSRITDNVLRRFAADEPIA